jgi:hypothetical protein
MAIFQPRSPAVTRVFPNGPARCRTPVGLCPIETFLIENVGVPEIAVSIGDSADRIFTIFTAGNLHRSSSQHREAFVAGN